MLLRETTVVDIQYNKKILSAQSEGLSEYRPNCTCHRRHILIWQKMTSATPS